MSFDQIADMLTRIKNASKAGKQDVSMPASNFKVEIAKLLHKYGYVEKVSIFSESNKKQLRLDLKYIGRYPAIKEIIQVSKQGQRIYAGKGNIPFVKNGMGVAIISTSKGLLTDREARKEGIGGEVICKLW